MSLLRIRIRLWLRAGQFARWYGDWHHRIAHDCYELSAECFKQAHASMDEFEKQIS